MRLTRHNNSTIARLSDHELDILRASVDLAVSHGMLDNLTTGQRKSWGRRVVGGEFLRIDRDKRDPANADH